MEMIIYLYDAGHMTKMAAMHIYGKNPSKIFFSGTSGLISTKLGMLLLIIVCSNDDPDLFYGKVKFCDFCFSIGKSGFFKNYYSQ